jgi:maltose alpha-D-glucosyltransferase/alpha-amylase
MKSFGKSTLGSDPHWYKDAIFYELRIRSFFDGNDDGVGDIQGLREKLDYVEDLGVDTLWLLPFYPSPLRDDGYDISDYETVHPEVGTLRDFKTFLREAHDRGLRVVTELVLNHTSDEHQWFQKARRSPPNSAARDFYVWSDTPERYSEARIIFKDYESSNWSWDPVARAYYWHRFYSHQPDLNFESARVRRALLQTVDFWLEMGVDGLRLDAVPYLFEREGTNCENLPEVHGFLRELRKHIDRRFSDRMLLAEANQWPEDAVAYFGSGDECHMAFHFPLMPRLFMAIHMEDRFPIADILHQTPHVPDGGQWALFLRNHDELTLEMVTDEERDYMYRVYASDHTARLNLGIRRRLAPLLGNDRNRIELMNALLFSMPGTPVLYYGDEIGMGDNFYLGDRNGVRTPMQWSGDRNAGFSRANPQKLYLPVIIDPEYHYETVNVETQQNNPSSLLWWMKRLIALRKQYRAFGRGSLELLSPANPRVLVFVRKLEDEQILVVCNLSRFVQYVELDLSPWKGCVPHELFGHTPFPPVGPHPYMLTLGPHSFYWFLLTPPRVSSLEAGNRDVRISLAGEWEEVLSEEVRPALEKAIEHHLPARRWFAGKARSVTRVEIADVLTVPATGSRLALVDVAYRDGGVETYQLPLAFASGASAERIRHVAPSAVIAAVSFSARPEPAAGILYDAAFDRALGSALLEAVDKRRRLKGLHGQAKGRGKRKLSLDGGAPEPVVSGAEQSNTSLVFGERFLFKLYRRLNEGVNPDLEIGRFLTEKAGFARTPPTLGAVEYERNGKSFTLGVLQGFVPNSGDAWTYTLGWLDRLFNQVLALPDPGQTVVLIEPGSQVSPTGELPEPVQEYLGGYLGLSRLLGLRTAELHCALASSLDEPDLVPEPFSSLYQRSLYQSMRNHAGRVFRVLRHGLDRLPGGIQQDAERLLGFENRLLGRFRKVLDHKLGGKRIRTHGDYHLGQILVAGSDVSVIDFEGEPARPISERRIKRSPLRDVAGMLRSFHYAAYAALPGYGPSGTTRPADQPLLEPWARFWHRWTRSVFLDAYFEGMASSKLLPGARSDIDLLLECFFLDKAVYELGYELSHRPDWAAIPLRAILEEVER